MFANVCVCLCESQYVLLTAFSLALFVVAVSFVLIWFVFYIIFFHYF